MQTLIRQLPDSGDDQPVFSWRTRDEAGRWTGPADTGGLEALTAACAGGEALLLLAGNDVVCTRHRVSAAEKRHLARLAPYELEDRLAGPPEDVHVAVGPVVAAGDVEQVVLAYTDKARLADTIALLEAGGINLAACSALPLLLPREQDGWTLLLADEVLHLHYGPALGFSIDMPLAPAMLEALLRQEAHAAALPRIVAIHADTDVGLQRLEACWRDAMGVACPDQSMPIAVSRRDDLWEMLAPADSLELDLRQGELARRLPWGRWWQAWRPAAMMVIVAMLLHAGVLAFRVQQLDGEFRAIEADMTQAYRAVVPDGLLVDAEQQLRNQLAQYGSGNADGGVLALLAQMSSQLQAQQGLAITRLNYNAERGELQLAISARTSADILALADALQARGLEAQPRNISRQGGQQLANLVVRGGRP